MTGSARTVLGLDIGSRTVDAVWLRGDPQQGGDLRRDTPCEWVVVDSSIVESGPDPAAAAARLAARGDHEIVVATGYGRRAAAEHLDAHILTEISAYALGAAHLYPQCRAILDVGGQDTKAIVLDDRARVADFEMNDRCAAGTGKFLEVMATALGLSIEELGAAALHAASSVRVSSMCTVFAESEVVGLLHRGEDRDRIALGLHEAVARRTLAMLKRAGAAGPLLFAGGVARNAAMQRLVADGYGGLVVIADEPQLVGALGAALQGVILRDAALRDAIPHGAMGRVGGGEGPTG